METAEKMKYDNVKVRIISSYTTCCFCPKPELPKGEIVDYQPVFYFKKAAEEYAKQNGLEIFCYSKYKSALANTKTVCNHGKRIVRLDWEIA